MGLTWPGRPSPRAVPGSARRAAPPPHRRDTRGTGAGTRVGPAEPLPRRHGKRAAPGRGRTAARGRRRQEIPKD